MIIYLIIGIIVFLVTLYFSFYLIKKSKEKLTVQHRLFLARKTKDLNKYSVLLLLASSVFYFILLQRLGYGIKHTVIIYVLLAVLFIAVFIYSMLKEIINLKEAELNLVKFIVSRCSLLGGIAFFMLFFYLFLVT